ncbi:zinc finger protein 436-like [Sardina pilchardus]|uniref:zinc finger protein 436-like n=1 Tax=Sardina pilchardus TaxID=27697 RepID=UPI002E143A8A
MLVQNIVQNSRFRHKRQIDRPKLTMQRTRGGRVRLTNSSWDHLCSASYMDLARPFSSGCAETHQFGLRVIVKEEDIKEEEYDHMITCPDEEEKPFVEFHCKTETDDTDSLRFSYNEMLQTIVKEEEVKKEEVKKEEEEEEEEEKEEEEVQHDEPGCLLESVSEHPHTTRQKIHGQNDDLSLQLKGRLHHCTVCRKSFTALREAEKHRQTHTFGRTELSTDKKTHDSGETCSASTSRPTSLTRDMPAHTGDKRPHECVQCGKTFRRLESLRRHHMLIYVRKKPHTCDQCGKGFIERSDLKAHMLVGLHTGEKPHKCVQCGKAFDRSTDLKRHMLIHTGEKPHKCVQCARAFLRFSSLTCHMLTHTRQKQPHKCVHCRKEFLQISALKTHMKMHTAEQLYTCVQCGKSFRRLANLQQMADAAVTLDIDFMNVLCAQSQRLSNGETQHSKDPPKAKRCWVGS